MATPKLQYIKASMIKKLAKQHGKRVGSDFLLALDGYVERKINDSCAEHNGGRKTLDSAIAGYFLGNR